jgi:hypothetical protein
VSRLYDDDGRDVSDCAGVTGEETEFLQILRKIEEMWRQGFVGSMTIDCGPQYQVKFKYTAVWKPTEERRKS